MKRLLLLVPVLAACIALPAQAGYRQMKDQLESYQPPMLVTPDPEPPAAALQAPEDALAKQTRVLEAVKAKWEADLRETDASLPFSPDARRLKSLAAAADDHFAATKLTTGFSLETLQALAWLRNPGIQAAKDRLRASLQALPQVTYLDEVLRSYSAFTDALMTGVGPMKGKDSVAPTFPFPGVMSLKGQVAEKEIEAARESLAATGRDVVSDARKIYWNLLFVRRARAIAQQMRDLLSRLESVATTRYESGKTSFQDVVKVRIQKETAAVDLKTLEERRNNIHAMIRALLGLPAGAGIGRPADRKPPMGVVPLNRLYAFARAHRQELLRMQAVVGKMERMIQMAETMIQPRFTTNLFLTQGKAVTTAGSAAMKPAFAVTAEAFTGAGLPKNAWFGTRDAYLMETRASLAAMKQELVGAQAMTDQRVRDAWFALDQARRESALYENTVVKLSQSALEVSTRGYESGTVGFADVIASHTLWLSANMTYQRKLADLGVARAELERVLGAPLP
jgi:cobalt-zinc-cadmium efflux system outer membrane protein